MVSCDDGHDHRTSLFWIAHKTAAKQAFHLVFTVHTTTVDLKRDYKLITRWGRGGKNGVHFCFCSFDFHRDLSLRKRALCITANLTSCRQARQSDFRSSCSGMGRSRPICDSHTIKTLLMWILLTLLVLGTTLWHEIPQIHSKMRLLYESDIVLQNAGLVA